MIQIMNSEDADMCYMEKTQLDPLTPTQMDPTLDPSEEPCTGEDILDALERDLNDDEDSQHESENSTEKPTQVMESTDALLQTLPLEDDLYYSYHIQNKKEEVSLEGGPLSFFYNSATSFMLDQHKKTNMPYHYGDPWFTTNKEEFKTSCENQSIGDPVFLYESKEDTMFGGRHVAMPDILKQVPIDFLRTIHSVDRLTGIMKTSTKTWSLSHGQLSAILWAIIPCTKRVKVYASSNFLTEHKKEGRKNTNKRSNKVGWDILMKETWKDGLTTPVKIMDCPTGTGKTAMQIMIAVMYLIMNQDDAYFDNIRYSDISKIRSIRSSKVYRNVYLIVYPKSLRSEFEEHVNMYVASNSEWMEEVGLNILIQPRITGGSFQTYLESLSGSLNVLLFPNDQPLDTNVDPLSPTYRLLGMNLDEGEMGRRSWVPAAGLNMLFTATISNFNNLVDGNPLIHYFPFPKTGPKSIPTSDSLESIFQKESKDKIQKACHQVALMKAITVPQKVVECIVQNMKSKLVKKVVHVTRRFEEEQDVHQEVFDPFDPFKEIKGDLKMTVGQTKRNAIVRRMDPRSISELILSSMHPHKGDEVCHQVFVPPLRHPETIVGPLNILGRLMTGANSLSMEEGKHPLRILVYTDFQTVKPSFLISQLKECDVTNIFDISEINDSKTLIKQQGTRLKHLYNETGIEPVKDPKKKDGNGRDEIDVQIQNEMIVLLADANKRSNCTKGQDFFNTDILILFGEIHESVIDQIKGRCVRICEKPKSRVHIVHIDFKQKQSNKRKRQ